MMKELTVPAETGQLERVTDFVNAELEALDCPMKALMQIDLAVEEIFVNIASYAYGEGRGEAVVRVETRVETRAGTETSPAFVRITFEDGGVPFDPTLRIDPDRSSPAEERPIGGLGIFLTKKTMDEVAYEYREGRNILSIRKNLS